MTMAWRQAPFALLDDPTEADQPTSRFYTGWAGQHICTDPTTLEATWAAVARDQAVGLHAVLLADYEWGEALMGLPARSPAPFGGPAALRVLMFRQMQRLFPTEVNALLQAADDDQAQPSVAGTLDLQASVTDAEFHSAIDQIHQAIRAGETYQINYTYRLRGQVFGAPAGLYRRLRQRQPAPYSAWIAWPSEAWNGEPEPSALHQVLSLSPELFLAVTPEQITARPMKGTAPRTGDAEQDAREAQALARDPKNRAENLMIVDLLRNDLGRLAEIGSVQVQDLFRVEHHASVLQMTSTVQARPRPEVDFPALLRATFPCGSITGAPKRQTLHWIRRLESTPRGLYCGAVGWVEPPPPGRRLGPACLSVAIRTLVLGAEQQGLRPLSMGVGAGIVLDSQAAQEAEECRLKARFLTDMDPGFELLETMKLAQGRVELAERHWARLAASARALGFAFDPVRARALLAAEALAADPAQAWRLRLVLRHDGRLTLTRVALEPMPLAADGRPAPVSLRLEPVPLAHHRPLVTHKTTHRAVYDAAMHAALAQGAFDSLLFSPEGWLLEGGRSNVLVKLDGRWFTPPLSSGVLPGVMRSALLDDPAWGLQERPIHRSELDQVQAWAVCNALRGVLPVSAVIG